MKPSLKAGLKHSFSYKVPTPKPFLRAMPDVFATGFMVGLMEWTCVQLLEPHRDEGEGNLGTHIDGTYKAATPVDFTVTVEAECIDVRGPRTRFRIVAHDKIDKIGAGTHERFIVSWGRLKRSVADKLAKASSGVGA